MGVVKRKEPQAQDPLQPKDFFSQFDTVPDTFGNVKTKETVRDLGAFNPNEYGFLSNPSVYDDKDVLSSLNASKQPYTKQIENSLQQFGAGFVSGFGQGLANLLDITAWGNDNYQSSLFGISTKEMQDWAEGVSQRNKILRENPGSFDPGSFGWWMEQVGSSGTGLGMGAFAIAETVGIEALTGGVGTGAAIAKVGELFSKLRKAKNVATLAESVNAVREMRSAATVFGILNRTNESRMEAMQSYDDIYNTMATEKNPDGTSKYTDAQLKEFAASGADRTFLGNMALLPLDILAFRTMVYNPISGSAEGFVEKAIGSIGNKVVRKATQAVVGSSLEGVEEGFQFVASQEGKHYAKVLGGTDDGSNFLQRFSKDVSSDEFWNNFAGGVIGSPIIGGAMNLANKVMTGNRTAKLNAIHADFIQNVGKMDSAIAATIKGLDEKGETRKADILRRQFGANKALGALHLDAMTDKNTAFDSYTTFLQGTIEELGAGKFDALGDLGIADPTLEQAQKIKADLEANLKDAHEMKGIYDNIKNKYNKNFVPEIAQDHYQLNRLVEAKDDAVQRIALLQTKLPQFGQLSTYGKEQYDAEYKLQTLMAEQSRLNEEYKSTENEQEKNNVNQLIDNNKAKITSIKERLDEIGKEDSYTKEERSLDTDILDSALRDKDYAQAMYDNERLDNAISLQRKNISLWNNREYLTRKVKESVKKARTKQQLDNTKEAASDSEEVSQEVKDREAAIAAQAAAQVVQQTQQGQITPDSIPGNGNLFEEDHNLINGITTVTNGKPVDDEAQNQNATESYLLAPSDFDFENSSDEAKAKVLNGVKGLVNRLQGEPNFEKLVRHVAQVQGIETADKIFNALKWGWEKAGYEATDYQAIYDKIFGNPMEDLLAGLQGIAIRTTGQLEAATNKTTEAVVAQQGKPEGFDSNNQPVYKYEGVVTNEASPKMAFTTRLSNLIQTTDEAGNIVVSHEYTEEELNHGDYVDSLQLLDPDKFEEGTEMEIRIPDNFMEIKIPVYNADGTKGQSVTFGQYVSQKNLTPEMQEYKDKIPMIIYKKNSPKGERGVSFVHDIGWYHPLRFHQEFQDSMDKAIAHTREIRKAILEADGNKADIVITGKRQTTFAGLKTKKGTDITLKEANPETQLTVALTVDSLSTSKNNRIFPNEDSELVNRTPFIVGQVIEVRRYGKKNGKKTFITLPVINPKLDEVSRSSVLQAINIYSNRSNQNPEIRGKHDPIVKHILDTMGLDIMSSQGLEKYLHHFISTFNTEKATTNEQVEAQAKAKLAAGTPYIAFIAGGNIVFGIAGQAAYVDRSGNKKGSFFINPNSTNPSTLSLNALAKPEMIGWFQQNVNLDNLNRNKPVVVIDKTLNSSIAAPNYNDFLLSRLRTNVRSYNIGTNEKPNYVTNVQPVITFDLKSNVTTQVKTNEQVAQEMKVEQVKAEATEEQTDNLSEIEKQIIEQAKKDLGSDFGISKDDITLLSPADMSNEQRESVTRSINRIAGLTPDQQFDVVDFMYNQVTAMVNLDTKQVTKADVDKQVDAAFKDVIEPVKVAYQIKVKELEETLQKHPALLNTQIPDVISDYKYRLFKIASIEQSLDILKDEAFNRVAKYTGITENKVVTEQENEEQTTEEGDNNSTAGVEEEKNERERDFWTDVLQESPESRLSYSMRRFFGQVRKYDKTGKPMTGFLGLPAYTGSDEVIRTLMVTLADVPSDFESMIARLEERKAGVPWMQEVIDRLKGASNQQKNQFVTVMSNTSLRMKFMMISYNKKTNSYTTKVWDTHLNGVAESVRREWESNFVDSNLVIVDEEGNYKLNDTKAKALIATFESWIGTSLKEIPFDMSPLRAIVDKVKIGKPTKFTPSGELATWLKTNVVKNSDRVKFSMKNQTFQVTKVKDDSNSFEISHLAQAGNNQDKEFRTQAKQWLQDFGITLSDDTFNELVEKGLFHNYQQRKPIELFDGSSNTNGLFGILYNSLKSLVEKPDVNFTEEGNSPMDNSVIKSLANLEAKYNTTNTPFGFRDNGKSFFALTAPKFMTDRVRDLKSVHSSVREQLMSISFSQNSLWLQLLGDDKFRDKFQVSHIGANAFKELGKKLYRDNAITKLADIDHELTKLGMFWDTTQGEVTFNTGYYPGTSVPMRMATVFSPTMSDKHMMTLITTAVLNLGNAQLNNGEGVNEQVNQIIYEQTVKPELQRMIKFWQNGGKTNISAYDKGAGLFLLLPEMNNLEYAPGLKLIDAIKHQSSHFTLEYIEQNEELMKAVSHVINEYVNKLTEEKLAAWKQSGLVTENDKNESELNFADKKYISKFRGTSSEVAKMAAMDFVVNYMIANSNSFMAMAGDPAIYFKSKADNYLDMAKDTFTNVGKRLANQIAPGTTLSNSENEKYIQIFIDDRKSLPEIPYLKFVTKINDGTEITDDEIEKLRSGSKEEKKAIAEKYPVSSGYFAIEGSDAQEYTTWKEHLDILEKLGKTPDTLLDITPEEISEARELFSSDVTRAKLTEKQMLLIGKVMQPIKPVYTGQLYDPQQDVMRTIYIKSSSFPLIPQLTAGFEIDKLRQSMEKLQSTSKLNVRASYQTANKVGSINNPVQLWNTDGHINEDALKEMGQSTLILDRKNFRIQQEIPFKSGKVGEDKITLGTQLMKLLFGDEIMNYDGFTYNGKSYTGKALHREYNQLFLRLVQEKRNQLFSELGLDSTGTPINVKKSMDKLQALLKDEAVKRGYPLQDIEGLTLTRDGQFNLPLWASSNSNRYESMLNAIVTNRLIRMKFPGNSFVVGSEEGFRRRKSDNLEDVDKSKIIWTSAWNGESLQGSFYDNGTIKKAQVLIASKFKDANGELIDLFTQENGEYKYITKTEKGFMLKEGMIGDELMSLISFRIPTSGHQSASQIEIVGFLPAESADLMIVPRNFTKQKGLDFDVDKENAYALWTHMTDDGKLEVLSEKHRAEILAKADKYFGDEDAEEDTNSEKKLAKLNSKINEKLMQNELIKINHAVMGSNNPKVQAKINKTLNTDFAEQQAELIDGLVNSTKNDKYWTPLSDEYQKQKMIAGASGKIGTGAYSLDVVFHSLVQQSAINGKPIQLIEVIGKGEDKTIRPKAWRFGNYVSDGKLGGTTTLDGGRSISELQAERQNVAVDNEKLQVMGRVNLNDITMDVDKVMNLLGFDKGEDGNSISFLFLSQPIVKEFVNKLRNANSNMAEFDSDKEQTAFEELLAKHEGQTEVEINDEYWNTMSRQMTNANFITAIQAEKPDGKLQAAVLRRFMEMRNYGIAIRNIQTTINTDSKGLGKSFFDVIEKRNALNRLGIDTNMITGASNLIGDYIAKDDITLQQVEDLQELGYVDIGKFLVKPDTLSGGFNIYGVTTAYNLWSRHFPYDAGVTQKAFTEIMTIIGSEGMSDSSVIERKQEIFRGMKKYLNASSNNGIVKAGTDVNEERARLFIDSETNTSLAKYMKTIMGITNNPIINQFIKSNKLFNRFEFDINKNGRPSLIKYNNASGEEFDEQYLYESLATLMELRGKTGDAELPEVGNKKYTLHTLAQDLISYCYLGNAIQEAIQFTKYVPVSYLNVTGYSRRMRGINLDLKDNLNILGMKVVDPKTQAHLVSKFTMQFIQHNPERVKTKFSEKNLNKLIVKNPNGTFTFKDNSKPVFVSVYDSSVSKGEKKFRLYWFDGAKYVQIPILGAFGMDEYQLGEDIGKSLVNGQVKSKAAPQATISGQKTEGDNTGVFNINSGDSLKIMEAIAKANTTVYGPLANYLLPYSDGIKVQVSDTLTLRNGKTTTVFNGYYNPNTNTVLIHPKMLNNPALLADTFVHEVVHSLTYHAVESHINTNPETGLAELVSPDVPMYVQNIVRIFNNLRANVSEAKMKEITDKMLVTGLTDTEKGKYYGFTNVHEFMTMALTNKTFQEELNKIEYKNTGKSILDKFKEFVSQVLNALGVKFDENYTAAHAISAIFDVIDKANFKSETNPYQQMFDDTMNEDTSYLDGLYDGEAPEGEFSPANQEEWMEAARQAIIKQHSKDSFMKEALLSDVDTALREASIQLKSQPETARKFYGEEFCDIALKLYPDETMQSKFVRDYISKLNSDQIDC